MRRFGLALGAFTVAASLAGCGSLSPAGGVGGQFKGLGFKTKNNKAEWTVLLHLAASNNLEPFADINLNEAEAGINSDKINFIVLFDGQKKGDSKIYRVVRDPKGMNQTLVSPVVDDKGAVIPASKEIDSGDYKTVAKFVSWGVQQYPANRYAYVSWDHGSGIFAANGARVNMGPGVDRRQLRNVFGDQLTSQGFAWDDETGNHVTTAQFTDILAAGAQAAGQPMDLAGFDACLMSHVEMTYQMKGLGKNLVASEELEPGLGWDYNLWLKYLSANPSADGAAHGGFIVKGYGESYRPGGAHHGGRQNDVTLSSVNYDALKNELVPAMNGLATELLAAMPSSKSEIQKARENAQEFYNSDCADLGSFLKGISSSKLPAGTKDSAQKVASAYAKAVTAEDHAGSGVEGATGHVVYFPKNKWSWKRDYEDPNKIAYAGEKWRSFLAEFIK